MEEINTGSEKNIDSSPESIEFDSAARNFLDTFADVPYENLTSEQRKLSDTIKNYLEQKRPTIH